MLAELKAFVDVLAKAVPLAYRGYQSQKRKEVLLELQEAFFIFKGLIETGEELLELAGPDPVLKVSELCAEQMDLHCATVQTRLTIQSFRMGRLGEIFLSKPFLDIQDPGLRRQFEAAVGGKGGGLYSLGAALFFHRLFGAARKQDELEDEFKRRIALEQAEFLRSIYAPGSGMIDVVEQRKLVEQLKQMQSKLAEMIDSLCTKEEQIDLASRAEVLAQKYCRLPE